MNETGQPPYSASYGDTPPDGWASTQAIAADDEIVPFFPSARLTVMLLIALSTAAAAVLFLLGYVARRMAANGDLAFTVRAGGGWKYWLPGALIALVVGAMCALIATRGERPDLPRITAVIFPAVTIV